MSVSCDICKYSTSHDYVPNHFYCGKNLFFNDKTPVSNCYEGEVDSFKYMLKYNKPYIEKEKENANK